MRARFEWILGSGGVRQNAHSATPMKVLLHVAWGQKAPNMARQPLEADNGGFEWVKKKNLLVEE